MSGHSRAARHSREGGNPSRVRMLALLFIVLPTFSFAQFPTSAKVTAEDARGQIRLQRPEELALMMLSAIQVAERECQKRLEVACTLEQLVNGPPGKDKWRMYKLKYDPATDPDYTYAITVNGRAWQAEARPRHGGLGGFLFVSKGMTPNVYYKPEGPASAKDFQLMGWGVDGDSFAVIQ